MEHPFLHADDEEVVGLHHAEVEGGRTVVIVLPDGGGKLGVAAVAGGFEVSQRPAAEAPGGQQQVEPDFDGPFRDG